MKKKTSLKPNMPKFGLWTDVWHSIRRAPYQAIIAVITMMFTFYTVTIFGLIAMGTHTVIKFMESKPQATAFFVTPPEGATLTDLRNKLQSVGQLREFNYIDQDKALEIYTKQNQDNPLLLEMVTANILPASVEISAENPVDLEKMAEVLKSDSMISDIIYPKQVVDEFLKWTTSIRTMGLENAGFLIILSFLLIFITMGVKTSLKRREIGILQLVGASGWYIHKPFIVEAIIYTLVGVTAGWGAAYTRMLYATPYLVYLFKPLGGLPNSFSLKTMLSLLGVELLAAIIGAAVATTMAVNRFMARH